MKTLKYSYRPTSVEGGKILRPSLQSLEELAHLEGASGHLAEAPAVNHHPHQHPKTDRAPVAFFQEQGSTILILGE